MQKSLVLILMRKQNKKLSLSVKSMIKGKKIFLISQFKEILKIKVSFTFPSFFIWRTNCHFLKVLNSEFSKTEIRK